MSEDMDVDGPGAAPVTGNDSDSTRMRDLSIQDESSNTHLSPGGHSSGGTSDLPGGGTSKATTPFSPRQSSPPKPSAEEVLDESLIDSDSDDDNSPLVDYSFKRTSSDDGQDNYEDMEDGEEALQLDEDAILASIEGWNKEVNAFDADNLPEDDRPQDLAYTFAHLDNELITGSKPFQNATLLCKYYGFADGKSLDAFLDTSLEVTAAMTPLMEYLKGQKSLNSSSKSGHNTFQAVMDELFKHEGNSKRNFSLRRQQSQASQTDKWTDATYFAACLWDLTTSLFEMGTGQFHLKRWTPSIKYNRMWMILQRQKRKMERRIASSTGDAQDDMKRVAYNVLKTRKITDLKASLEAFKEKTGKQLSKSNKLLQKQERRLQREQRLITKRDEDRRKKLVASGEDPDSEQFKNQPKDMLDLHYEDTQREVQYQRNEQFVLDQQYKAITSNSLSRMLNKREKHILNGGDAEQVTEQQIQALVDCLGNPECFEPETWETELMNKTLEIHLPKLEKESFTVRMNEKEANDNAIRMIKLNNAARAAGNREPVPGLQQTMYALMEVLYPDEWQNMLMKSNLGQDATVAQIEKLRFDKSTGDPLVNIANAEGAFAMRQGEALSEQFEKSAETLGDGLERIRTKKAAAGMAGAKTKAAAVGVDMGKVGQLLSNVNWENDNFIEACKRLDVDPGRPIQLPGMRPGGPCLYWFQALALVSMIEKMEKGLVQGVILAAVVGLGKTITVLAYIMWAHNQHLEKLRTAEETFRDDPEALRKEIENIGHPRPWLILVPGVLITQWAKEATKMSAHFRIIIYHSERKRTSLSVDIGSKENASTVPVEYERINKPLARNSKALNGIQVPPPEDYAKLTIVISTPQTLVVRHGPAVLSKRRIDRYTREFQAGVTNAGEYRRKVEAAKEGTKTSIWQQSDDRWPGDLSGVFGGLIIDEAHSFRNPTSQAVIAANWTLVDRKILLTATPVYHSYRDVLGYLQLLQTPAAIRAQSPFNGDKASEFPNACAARSPYDPKYIAQHTKNGVLDMQTRLRSLTVAAFKKYVTGKDTMSEGHQGLERVFNEILVRTNYDSSLPHGQPQFSIGKKLPEQVRYTSQMPLSEKWKNIFDFYTAEALRRIRMPLKGRNTVNQALGVNANAHRHCSIGSTFPFTVLVGVPKDHPCLFSHDHERIKKNRSDFYQRARVAYRIKQIKEMKLKVYDSKAPAWRGFPDADPPHVDMSAMPSEAETLEKLWKRHETEYSLQELDITTFFQTLAKSCPGRELGWTQEAWVINELLHLARNNPDKPIGKDGEALTVDSVGEDMIPELPARDSKYTEDTRRFLLQFLKDNCPRLKPLLEIALDCTKRCERASVWTSFPGSQYLTYYTLKLAKVPTQLFASALERTGRDELVDRFNSLEPNDCMFMVCTYGMGGQGLNFQFGSHIVLQLEMPVNLAQDQQCVGRSYRLGQLWTVYIFRIFVLESHDDWTNNRAYKMAVHELRASLDKDTLFSFTQAVCPANEPLEAFKTRLKSSLTGFYLNRDARDGHTIRHVSSFPKSTLDPDERKNVEAFIAAQELIVKDKEIIEPLREKARALLAGAKIDLAYSISKKWEALTTDGFLFYIYSLRTGFDLSQRDTDDEHSEAFLLQYVDHLSREHENEELADALAAEAEADADRASAVATGAPSAGAPSPAKKANRSGPKDAKKKSSKGLPNPTVTDEASRQMVQRNGQSVRAKNLTVAQLKEVFKDHSFALPSDERKNSLLNTLSQEMASAGSAGREGEQIPMGQMPSHPGRRGVKRGREEGESEANSRRFKSNPFVHTSDEEEDEDMEGFGDE